MTLIPASFVPIRISIVIPTLHSPLLEQTLAGIARQSYNPAQIEVIVVGQDRFESTKRYSTVQFIDTIKACPPAVSRNIGLQRATGEIVCFIDDDCVPKDDWVATLAQCYQDDAIEVVGGGIEFPLRGYWAQVDAVAGAFEQLAFRPAGIRRQLPSMNFSARRQLLLAQKGFDESFPVASGEDAELCMRLRREGHLLHFVPDACIEHLGWRGTLPGMLQHICRYGMYSPWINPRLADVVKPPIFLRHWLLMLLAIVPLAGWITLRMYLREPHLRSHWRLFPGLVLAQLAWGWGVVRGLHAKPQG